MHKRLINKYGEKITIDNVKTKAYFEEVAKTYYLKKYARFTSFDIEVIHTIKEVSLDAVLKIRNKDYLVLDSKPVRTSGKISYSETVLFEDDFTNDITIAKLESSIAGCNIPKTSQNGIISTKARITTVKPIKTLELSAQGKAPTHIFLLKYIDGIKANSIVSMGTRKFEIITIENIDEKNKLLEINTIEVLNV